MYDFRIDLDARKLAAITLVAGGYGDDIAYDLLDDIYFGEAFKSCYLYFCRSIFKNKS